MNKQEYDLLLIKQADDIVDYCEKKGITIKQYFEMKDKQQYHREHKELQNTRKTQIKAPNLSKKYSCLYFYGISYESDDIEQERGEEYYREQEWDKNLFI